MGGREGGCRERDGSERWSGKEDRVGGNHGRVGGIMYGGGTVKVKKREGWGREGVGRR